MHLILYGDQALMLVFNKENKERSTMSHSDNCGSIKLLRNSFFYKEQIDIDHKRNSRS